MQINLSVNQWWIAPSLREHVLSNVRAAFSALRGKGLRISVFLRDLKRQEDGREKMCRISVIIPNQPEILIEDVQESMYTAIDIAARKAAHRAKRILACRYSRTKKTTSVEP